MGYPYDLYGPVREGDLATVRQIIAANPHYLRCDYIGQSWLHVAATFGRTDVAMYLLDCGLDLNAAEEDWPDTPLDKAAVNAQLETCKAFLRAGAQIRQTSGDIAGTIISAVSGGSHEVIDLLIQHGADPNACCGFPPQNALSHALDIGDSSIANYLRSLGYAAPPEATDATNHSLHSEIIKHFTNYGPVHPLALREIVPGTVAISIHAVPPQTRWDPLILFTTGMSDQALNVPTGYSGDRYVELLMALPGDWPWGNESVKETVNFWPFGWLRRAAHYFHDQGTWIGTGLGLVVNGAPSEPLAPGLRFDSLLLFTHDGDSARIRLRDGREVGVYTVVPLDPAEREYGQRQGLEALFQRIQTLPDSAVVNLARRSVGP